MPAVCWLSLWWLAPSWCHAVALRIAGTKRAGCSPCCDPSLSGVPAPPRSSSRRPQVRQLASAAALDGTVDAAAAKWVRHQKTTLLELQRRAAEKAQQVFEKQASGRCRLGCAHPGPTSAGALIGLGRSDVQPCARLAFYNNAVPPLP